jgi:hypothetical protein
MSSDTFSSICPGMMPKSLRLMVKVEQWGLLALQKPL